MSTLSSATLSCGSCVRCRGRAHARYQEGIKFPEPAFPGSDNVTPSRPGLLNQSVSSSLGQLGRSHHVSTSLEPLGVDTVISSDAENNFCLDIPSQSLSGNILNGDLHRHVLSVTKTKLPDIQRNVSTFEIQKGVIIE